ncbi:receptor-type tyrosine-protein phosphatase eta-like [Sinocyclocheilus grahami]|uniref:receptor-type tyrosine-protein phosphatase eta-like n=1 Tax=Sinocyclocheilus grahami TaxID=75366 RepID=UPI0007ACC1A6|nr:PREDICTED: receptor-type tyrosine-protein phosphatase eta-like [Sinocyclocheilus grahami]
MFLTWAEPFGNRSFFKLNWTDENLDLNRNAIETNNTSYHITGLTAGVSYTFCITAVAADQSTEGETVCISNYTKPNVIKNLVSKITTSSVFLTWDEPVGNRSFFKLQWADDKTDATTNTSYHISGLTAGVNYTFCITAVAADQSTEGETVCISQFTKPDVIRNLRVNNITTSSVFLSWDEPVGNRSFFIVQWADDKTDATTNTSYHITGLTAGVNYTFCITAVTADQSTEGETVCISQFTKPDVIRNLRVTNFTTSSVFLTWDKPVGNRSFFKVHRTDDKTNKTTTNTSYHISGLTAGVNYTFCITAVAADQSTEGETVCISQFTKPDVIRNLSVNNITTSSVFLTWDKPVGNRSFFKLHRTDDKTNKTTTNTSYHITGLTAGVSYTFCITAVAADQSTEGETVCISNYTKPDVIRNLRVNNITTSSVFLRWDEPVGNRSFFKLHRTDDKTNKTTTHTSYHITGLTAGVSYTFCITAVAADQSTEGETVCISNYTKPDVIRNLSVNNITTSSVFLRWEEPFGYRSFFKLHRTDDKTNKTTTNTSYHISGLTAGVSYTFCITAVAADQSTEGETVCISQFTKPNMIINLTVSEITPSSVFLTWEEPVGNRSFFKIQWTGDKTNGSSTTSNTSYHITDLTAGVSYTFIITAVAADQSTEGESVVTSKYTKPDVIMNLTADDITTSSVFLNWTKPNGQSSRYRVEYEDKNVITENTSININDLIPGAQYTFRVFAVAADHLTEGRANQISLYTKPGVIRILKITEITTSSVFLKWNETVGSRSFFNLNWSDGKTSNHTITNNTWYNITGLTAGVNYTFIITAVAADNSTEGETVCISNYTKPDVIKKLRVTDVTKSSVSLTWNEPAGNRDFFRIQWSEKRKYVTTTNTSYHITGLTAGVSYTFIITAVAADNSTEGETVCISNYTKPDVIKKLRVTDVTQSSVYLTWNEPAGNRDFFRIQWSEKRKYVTTTNTSYHISGLTAGVSYTFCITAVAADQSTEGNTVCISQFTDSPESHTPLIVGVVLAVICFLFIITLILFFYSRRQTKKQCPDIPVHTISNKINVALRIEDYEEYFKQKHADSNCGFAEEYEELKTVGTAQSKNTALAIENKPKNRYSNVLPYDASRVKLSMCGSPFDDYINANYIPGYNSRKEFIAAQGPLPVTVNEFWRMVWEKNVFTIVMLTKCNEMGRVKCEKYWPSGTNHYQNISVTTTSEIELESWIIRDFRIKNVKTAETRYVRQFHFTAWPDHGVPQTTEVLIDFRHLVREHMDQYSRHSPTVVHCSAGVGRTGTFTAIDHLIFQIERDSMVDIYGIVNDMRMHRPLMVQTEEQYVYLHQCAYDIIRSRTGTNVDLIYQNAAAFNIYQNVNYQKS